MMQEHPGKIKIEGKSGSQQQENRIAGTVNEYGKIVLFVLAAAIVLKIFVVDAFRIPSASMENTLKAGDFILVNKLAYGLRSPRFFPFTNIRLPVYSIFLFKKIRRGDVIVFELPKSFSKNYSGSAVNFIKRCAALPGDTVEIRNNKIFINGEETPFPRLAIRTRGPGNLSLEDEKERGELRFDSVVVPGRGDVIALNPSSFVRWKNLIENEGHSIIQQQGSFLIDEKRTGSYIVEQDHYFVLGDNRDNSMDSRYWGFLPDDHIIGEAILIYWSWDRDFKSGGFFEMFSAARWNRIGTIIR
jgi:signal peptidase I